MDIFVVKITDSDNIDNDLLEKFCYKNFSDAQKKTEHCFSYLMSDRILKEVYKIESREIEFVNKKPYLKSREKFFSISHSGEYAVIAVSDNECGVDIEQIKERDYKSISERMKFNSDSLEDFYKNWTNYEAEYKLGNKAQSFCQTKIFDYVISAVSKNPSEKFEIYIQNGEEFPNL